MRKGPGIVEENDEKSIEQRQKRSSKKRRKIKLRRFILLLLAAAVIVLIALNWDRLSPVAILQRIQAAENGAGVVIEYPADIAGQEIAAISGFGSGGILAANSGCFLLRADNALYYRYAMASTTAAIGDKSALIYEKGGTKFQFFNAEGRVFEQESADKIVRMACAKNGSYALLTAPSEYSSKLTIFSSSHKEMFSQFFKTPNLTRIALNSSAKYCAVIVTETANGQLSSNLTVYDTGKPDPVFTRSFTGLLALDMKYCDDGGLVIVFDRAAVRLNAGNEAVWQADYTGLAAFSVSADGTVGLLSDNPEGVGCTLSVYNAKGIVWTAQVPGQSKGLTVRDEKAVCISGSKLILLDEAGKIAGSEDCSLDTNAAVLGDRFIIFAGKDKISRVSLSSLQKPSGTSS